MLSRFWRGPERRNFDRHEIVIDVEIEIEVYGFEEESRPFFASGRTINISRSGVLASVDMPVSRGSVCKLFFRRAHDRVRPHHVAGRIVRMRPEGNEFRIAVQFDEPLVHLDAEASVEVAAGLGSGR